MAPIVSLQNLFELRKTQSLSGTRSAVARVFEHLGRLGLCDASGALWPVVLEVNPLSLKRAALTPGGARGSGIPPEEHGLFQGDLLNFSGAFFRPDGSRSTKYQDAGYVLRIDSVTEVVRSCGPWEAASIAEPLPGPEECATLLGEFDESRGTLFFRTATHARGLRLRRRVRALERVRAYFSERGFFEVDAPTLVASGGVESYLNTFQTHYTDHRGRRHGFELPTSPEFALKRMLAEGCPKVFALAKAFRNRGELSAWHEPEFLMLEWYRIGADPGELMEDTRSLVSHLAAAVGEGGFEDLHWPVFTVSELFRAHAGLELESLQDARAFAQAASGKSVSVRLGDEWNDTFCKVFMDLIEPELKKLPACFVTEYPRQQAVLAACVPGKPFVKRFEAYLRGVEICNGFEELTDAAEMDSLFRHVSAARTEVKRDPVFESAMRYGLPPCSGNALGIDRVIALLLRAEGIGSLAALPFLARAPKGEIAAE